MSLVRNDRAFTDKRRHLSDDDDDDADADAAGCCFAIVDDDAVPSLFDAGFSPCVVPSVIAMPKVIEVVDSSTKLLAACIDRERSVAGVFVVKAVVL